MLEENKLKENTTFINIALIRMHRNVFIIA